MGLVKGLIIGGVNVMHPCLQTGIHDMEVLIGKGKIEDDVGLKFVYESDKFRYIVGIYLCCLNVSVISFLNIFFDCLAFGERPACNQYFLENFRDLRAFVYRHGGDASCSYYHYSSTILYIIHRYSPERYMHILYCILFIQFCLLNQVTKFELIVHTFSHHVLQ